MPIFLKEIAFTKVTEPLVENPRSGWVKPFRELICEKLECTAAEFEERVFWKTLHWHSLPVALWVYRKNPAAFREDFEFIREIGTVSDPDTFKTELNRFHGRNVRDRTWLRGTFSIRVSAKRLIRLKNKILFPRNSKN